MSTAIQRRRGTTAQHASFAGLNGELTVDTDKKTVVVHDGATAGGFPLARQDFSNVSSLALPAGAAATPVYSFTGDTNTGIYSPGADQVAISTNGAGRLFVNADGSIDFGTTTGSVTPTVKAAANPVLSFSNGTNSAYVGLVGVNNRLLNFSTNGTTLIQSDSAINLNVVGGSTFTVGTNNTERLRVTSAGLVGIGTSSPSTLLDLSSSTNTYQTIQSTNANSNALTYYKNSAAVSSGFYVGFNADEEAMLWQSENNAIRIGTNNAERIRIDSSGRVGIGTTSPNQSLHVNGIIQADSSGNYLQLQQATNDSFINNTGSGGIIFRQGAGFTERARIDSAGRWLLGTSSARSVAGQSHLVQLESVNSSPFSGVSIVNNANDGNGSYLILGKSRGTSVGSNTVVQNGDQIGGISFAAADGSNITGTAASITCNIDAAPGTNDVPGRLVFSVTSDGASSPTERMRINTSGALKASTNGGYQNSTSASHEFYQTNNEDILRLRASSASFANTGIDINIDRNTTNGTYYFYRANCTGVATRYQVLDSGNVQNANNSYTGISDSKLKENIIDAGSQWNDIKEIRVRNYNFKEETGQPTHRQIGLIAQELETVCPNLVDALNDRDEDGNDLGTVTKSVNYSVLYMKAVKALQEAMERIETLEAKVAALESA